MADDRYQSLTNSGLGGLVARRVGLPTPPIHERRRPGMPVVTGPVALGGARGGRLADPAREVLRSIGASVVEGEDSEPAALVYDASAIDGVERLRALYEFFGPRIRGLRRNGRVVVLAGEEAEIAEPEAAIAQRAIEGFVRSIAKEIGG
jgi:3-oxoacyl-[acyl-carrier protein] reductase